MTLCVAWKTKGYVHFASDSRLSFTEVSYADVAIKVLSLRIRLYPPHDEGTTRTPDLQSEIGMCFAGSSVNSLVIKETIEEILKDITYAPGSSDSSMEGIARLIFRVYENISRQLAATDLGTKALATLIITGYCAEERRVRTYHLSVTSRNEYSMTEILTANAGHLFIGTRQATAMAERLLPSPPSDRDYLNALKGVIDAGVTGVGGAIQYGTFASGRFKVSGVTMMKDDVQYMRGGIDLNAAEMLEDGLVSGLTYIDLDAI
jgi:hypothetical protein